MIRFRQLWEDVQSSLWFLPGIIVMAAVALAIGLIQADLHVPRTVFAEWPRLFGSGADGARGLLATVASSMITVAGVVFSITIVALSLASSQYTSRVLRNFMRDRVNQAVLGLFVGIFAYCLVVLRTIRGGDEGVFVPSMAVLFGLILAFVGIAVFIYFIHHISTSIQAAHILAAIAGETIRAIDHLFPEGVAEEEHPEDPVLQPGQAWYMVPATATGYIQSLGASGLMAFARERETVVRMERAIGQFVIEGTPLASVLGTAAPTDDEKSRIGALYAVGPQRTLEQDAAFGVRQIVDVALKALSPGVNDTTTAVMCLDYLTAILVRLTTRRIESRYRSEDGELRLVTRGPTYSTLVCESLDQIRQSAAGNLTVLDCLLATIELLASQTDAPLRRHVLADQAESIAEVGHRSILSPHDRERIDARSARLVQQLAA